MAADARKTAVEIGAALAKAGLGLVVYFSNDESLVSLSIERRISEIEPSVLDTHQKQAARRSGRSGANAASRFETRPEIVLA